MFVIIHANTQPPTLHHLLPSVVDALKTEHTQTKDKKENGYSASVAFPDVWDLNIPFAAVISPLFT